MAVFLALSPISDHIFKVFPLGRATDRATLEFLCLSLHTHAEQYKHIYGNCMKQTGLQLCCTDAASHGSEERARLVVPGSLRTGCFSAGKI